MSFYGNRRKPSKADLAHQREMSAPPCGFRWTRVEEELGNGRTHVCFHRKHDEDVRHLCACGESHE
jgi:hypothetical protein